MLKNLKTVAKATKFLKRENGHDFHKAKRPFFKR